MTVIFGLLRALPFVFIGFLFLGAYTYIRSKWLVRFSEIKEIGKNNQAAAWSLGTAYLGLTIALLGSLFRVEESYALDLLMFAADSAFAVLAFSFAAWALDLVILRKIDNYQQIRDDNMAMAIIDSHANIALGAILWGAFTGGGQTFWVGILSAFAFGAFGLVPLIGVYWLYDWLYHRITQHSIDQAIAEGDTVSARAVGSILLAIGISIAFSIAGDSVGWHKDVTTYLSAAPVGILLVLTLHILLMRAFGGVERANPAQAVIVDVLTVAGGSSVGVIIYCIVP